MLQGRRVVLRDIFTQVLSSIIERETHHTRYMCVQDHYRILGTGAFEYERLDMHDMFTYL